jgi:hypothetical protein
VSGALAMSLVAGVVALAMLQLGIELKLISVNAVRRCGACGRLVRRGRVCRCAEPRPE